MLGDPANSGFLQPSELPINLRFDLPNILPLLVQSRRLQRLIDADVSRARVAVGEAGKEAFVALVFVTFTVAIELIQDVWDFARDLMGLRCLSDKASGGKGWPRLPLGDSPPGG